MSTPLATTRLLLDALRPEQTPDNWLERFQRGEGDWEGLAVRAIAFGLAPALHARLAGWGAEVPPRTAAKLAVTRQAQARRNQAIYQQLDEILAAGAAAGLRPIALKGVHLAACYYAEPALRPMNDIDLLLAPEEMAAAAAVLESLGYQGRHKAAELGPGVTKHTSTYRRQGAAAATPNPYLSAAGDRTVEPHTSLEESWFGLKVDITPGVRQRAETVTLGTQPARVLAAEDLLLHLCVHFCFHLIMGQPALVQLHDLLVVTAARNLVAMISWPLFVARAVEGNAAPYALAALTLAARLLSAAAPPEVLAGLERATPVGLRRRIGRLELEHVLRRSQQRPLTTIAQRLWRGLADRAETARWASGWRGRWQVWRTALDVGRTDTARMVLRRVWAGPDDVTP